MVSLNELGHTQLFAIDRTTLYPFGMWFQRTNNRVEVLHNPKKEVRQLTPLECSHAVFNWQYKV